MLMADLDDDTSIISCNQLLRNTFTFIHNPNQSFSFPQLQIPSLSLPHNPEEEAKNLFQTSIHLIMREGQRDLKYKIRTERSVELGTTWSFSSLGSCSRAPKIELKSSCNSVSMSMATIPCPTNSCCILCAAAAT
jgi:hypothetical protein